MYAPLWRLINPTIDQKRYKKFPAPILTGTCYLIYSRAAGAVIKRSPPSKNFAPKRFVFDPFQRRSVRSFITKMTECGHFNFKWRLYFIYEGRNRGKNERPPKFPRIYLDRNAFRKIAGGRGDVYLIPLTSRRERKGPVIQFWLLVARCSACSMQRTKHFLSGNLLKAEAGPAQSSLVSFLVRKKLSYIRRCLDPNPARLHK